MGSETQGGVPQPHSAGKFVNVKLWAERSDRQSGDARRRKAAEDGGNWYRADASRFKGKTGAPGAATNLLTSDNTPARSGGLGAPHLNNSILPATGFRCDPKSLTDKMCQREEYVIADFTKRRHLRNPVGGVFSGKTLRVVSGLRKSRVVDLRIRQVP